MLSPADRLLVHRDTGIPGLGLVLDAAAMLELLRDACEGGDVQAVTPRYLRYKPGTNALVAHDVRVDGLTVSVHAKAHTAGDGPSFESRMRKADGRAVCHPVLGFSRMLLPDVRVGVSAFPNDEKVRDLVSVIDDARRRDLLQRAVASRPMLAEAGLRPLSYKPERRFVGSLMVEGRPEAVVRVQARGTPLRPSLPPSTRLLRLQRVLGRREWRGVSITDWIEGDTFEHLVGRGEAGSVAAEVGRALATLHALPGEGVPERRVSDDRQAIEAAASLVAVVLPELGLAARDLATRVGVLLKAPVRPVLVHGDLHQGQLVLGTSGVGLIDLDEVACGAAMSDLASLVASVLADTVTDRVATAEAFAIADAVVDGYDREAGGTLTGLDTWVAAHLLRRVPQPFRARQANWPTTTERLLSLARGALDTPRWRERRPAAALRIPSDPAMPALALAAQPRHVEQALAGLPGQGWRHVRVCEVRLLRHKPGRRGLIEYAVAGVPPRPDHIVTVIAKVRARGADERTASLMRQLWDGVFAPDSAHGASVPQPFGVVPGLSCWLQARVPGVPATEWAWGSDAEPVMRRAAAALRLLHTSDIVVHRSHDVEAELSALHPRLARLAAARPALTTRVARLAAACAARLGRLPSARPALVHRDFHPDHLLWNGTRLHLIDFDLAAHGDAALDVGNLVAHLVELGLRRHGDEASLRPAIDAFVHAYLSDAPEVTAAAVEAWTVVALVRLAALSVDLPGRGHTTAALIDLCERRLDVAPPLTLAVRPSVVETP